VDNSSAASFLLIFFFAGKKRYAACVAGSPPRSRRLAFTLVELLVAMVLIAVVAALTFPLVNRSIESSRSTGCLSNLRQLGMGLSAYLQEHDATMPKLEIGRKDIGQEADVIDTVLARYVPQKGVFACPSDTKKRFAEKTGTSYFWNSGLNEQRLASLNFLKLSEDHSRIPVMGDKEGFHIYQPEKVNLLYADGHASKELVFRTEK
jgi:prepilin-type N-terminal cleavage/methylation domain-containing protein/prepilin-type processing-associated H-X9-DG protein